MRIVVVGGGISGLSTAFALRERAAARGVPLELTLLEASPELGGTIRTYEEEGYRCEGGPNGFLDSKPQMLDLVRRAGLEDRLLASSDASRRRFVMVKGRLVELPTSPPAFLRSPLLSVGGRLRVLWEPFARKAPGGVDETVAAFARRRLGRQAAERLIDPFVSGVFAGNSETLSLKAAFPRLVELEAEYGSLITASRKLKKKGGEGGAAGPGGRLTSMKGGMGELVRRLGEVLGSSVRTSAPLSSLATSGGRWTVGHDGGSIEGADAVVLAIPAYAAAGVLGRIDDALATPLAAIPYSAASVVGLGFRREDVGHALDSFGFLVPSGEGRRILGSLFTSSIFPGHRAPDGRVLIRTIVGGARAGEVAMLPDDELVALVTGELRALLDLRAEPVYRRIIRWPNAIPQYVVGHVDRVAALESALSRWPGLFVTGNALRGVGLNDCARESEATAARVLP